MFSVSDREKAMYYVIELMKIGLEDLANNYHYFLRNFIITAKEKLPFDIRIYNGASKVVFLIDGFDWVIKVNRGCGGMEIDGVETDCQLEVINYQIAKEKELDSFFAETHFLACMNGIDIIVQEKMEEMLSEEKLSTIPSFVSYAESNYTWDNYESKSESESESEYEYSYTFSDVVDEFGDDDFLYGLYGYDFGGMLISFCEDNDINDLHRGNFGCDKDGFVKIIDFCGYH